jgi:hypothetical protein
MGNAITQRAEIIQLERDANALDTPRLEDWPQVLPEMVAAPAEQ